jgi:xanthine dehydrogenase accessory factor
VTPDILRDILRAREAGQALVLATRLADGAQRILPQDEAPQQLLDAAALALSRDESRQVDILGEAWFIQVYAPAHRLIIVGAVHVAQSLAPLAAALAYDVTVVDPRRAFNSEARFPGVVRNLAWPDEALAELAPDSRTAIVTLTHDPKFDDPALDVALHSAAFYLGALGSRRTHAARLARLAGFGHAPAALARIRSPVGLALGAVAPPEIALSILAEIVAVRRGAALAVRS